MNNNEIDKLIEDSISLSLNDFELQDEVFIKVKDNINSEEKRNNYKTLKFRFNRSNSLKVVVSILCVAILFCSLSLAISPNARVFAAEAINAIKTIFVYDEKGQIVEKSQKDRIFIYGGSSTTTLNDYEIEKKIGFKVVLPKNLPQDFELKHKSIGVMLQKKIDYETGEKLQLSVQKAATEDAELERLKEYNPIRTITGFYENQEGTVAINVNKTSDDLKYIEAVENSKNIGKVIKIGSINGIWTKSKIPKYPMITKDDIGSNDMTQGPTGTTTIYSIVWVSNGLWFHLGTIGEFELTQKVGIRIAEAFMESQK